MKYKVDLIINTFERTYRKVLTPGFFNDIERQNKFQFTNKIALINNVKDEKDAISRAEQLKETGEINKYYLVKDYINQALSSLGLTKKDLGRIPYYSNCAYVAIILSESEWLVYWDAEIKLKEPYDWINPAIHLMENDSRIMVANPRWNAQGLEKEAREIFPDWYIGYGFSDQLFLIRRSDFLKPIYKESCLISLRYPLSHIGKVFEQRVDSYMRTHRKLRATFKYATYIHPKNEGESYPAPTTTEKLKQIRNKSLLKYLAILPGSDPRFKI